MTLEGLEGLVDAYGKAERHPLSSGPSGEAHSAYMTLLSALRALVEERDMATRNAAFYREVLLDIRQRTFAAHLSTPSVADAEIAKQALARPHVQAEIAALLVQRAEPETPDYDTKTERARRGYYDPSEGPVPPEPEKGEIRNRTPFPSKEWCIEMALLEGKAEIGAGHDYLVHETISGLIRCPMCGDRIRAAVAAPPAEHGETREYLGQEIAELQRQNVALRERLEGYERAAFAPPAERLREWQAHQKAMRNTPHSFVPARLDYCAECDGEKGDAVHTEPRADQKEGTER